ncbi:MAG: glycosyltransferase family 4 protein [Alphaproteobacteria bacterium]|nr:glycosyltransferase family 4 protein [Alphaproteobacteria bacterium]
MDAAEIQTAKTETQEPPPRVAADAPGVLQVLPALVTGGVERGAVDVALAAKAAGLRSYVVSAGGPMQRELNRAGVTHIQAPTDSKNLFTLRANTRLLVDLIQRHKIDIVHARSRAPAWSAKAAAAQTGTAFLTTFHATYNYGNLIKKAYNRVMTQGDRVIAISEFIRDHIIGHYHTDWARVRVIHRGVDTAIFDPAAVSAERVVKLAQQWRLPDGLPVIMLPGRLTRWKGQILLLRALAKLENKGFRCLLVGDDQGNSAYQDEIERTARKLGLEGHVHVVGDCNDMAAAYKLADVVVSASTDPEGFGRVAIEGQALGRPVVAPRHGAAPEQISHGETGWLYTPGDADDLAHVLTLALGLDEAARDRLHAKAIANVRNHFTKEEMCRKTIALYGEMAERRRLG